MNKENIRAFKFRSGNNNDLDSLFENYMWLSRLTDLNDPYEGYAYFSNEGIDDDFRETFLASVYEKDPIEGINASIDAKNLRDKYSNNQGDTFSNYIDMKASRIISDFYNEHKNDYKILSLSLQKDEYEHPAPLNNMLMWSHYANGFKGFCIEFNFRKLINSLKIINDTEISTSLVKYATDGKLPIVKMKTFMQSTMDDSKDLSLEILSAFSVKEQSWYYENEIRAISEKGGKLYYDTDCINAIYISEKSPEWLKISIMSYVTVKNTNIKIFLVKLHDSEYKFGYTQINA